jgi:hypothetical protein
MPRRSTTLPTALRSTRRRRSSAWSRSPPDRPVIPRSTSPQLSSHVFHPYAGPSRILNAAPHMAEASAPQRSAPSRCACSAAARARSASTWRSRRTKPGTLRGRRTPVRRIGLVTSPTPKPIPKSNPSAETPTYAGSFTGTALALAHHRLLRADRWASLGAPTHLGRRVRTSLLSASATA